MIGLFHAPVTLNEGPDNWNGTKLLSIPLYLNHIRFDKNQIINI